MKTKSYNLKSWLLTLALALLGLPASLYASDYTWNYTGASSSAQNWNTSANWSPTGTPGQSSGQTDNIIGFDVSNQANLSSTTNTTYTLGTLTVTPLGGQATATTPTWVIEGTGTLNYSLNISTVNVNPTQVAGTTFTFRDAANSAALLNLTVGQLNIYGAPTATTLNLGVANNATTTGVLSSLNVTGGTTFLGSGTSITNLNTIVGNTENLGLIKTDATFSGNATLNLNDNNGNSVNNTNVIATSGLSSDPNASGTLTIVGSVSPSTTVNITSTLAINNSANYTANFSLVDQTITGAKGRLAVTKAGVGTQTLTGPSTYSGGTTVTGGTLLANNASGSGTGVGAVAVSGNGTLGGNGIVAPTGTNGISVTSGGTLAPGGTQTTVPFGGTPGTSANGKLTLNTTGSSTSTTILSFSSAKLTFALGAGTTTNANGENTSGGQVVVTGGTANTIAFDLLNPSTVTIDDLVGAQLNLNQEYVLIDGNGTAYTGLSYGATSNLGTQITGGIKLLASGTSGNFFSQWYNTSQLYLQGDNIDVLVIPEPQSWALMLGGLVLLFVIQARKSARRS